LDLTDFVPSSKPRFANGIGGAVQILGHGQHAGLGGTFHALKGFDDTTLLSIAVDNKRDTEGSRAGLNKIAIFTEMGSIRTYLDLIGQEKLNHLVEYLGSNDLVRGYGVQENNVYLEHMSSQAIDSCNAASALALAKTYPATAAALPRSMSDEEVSIAYNLTDEFLSAQGFEEIPVDVQELFFARMVDGSHLDFVQQVLNRDLSSANDIDMATDHINALFSTTDPESALRIQHDIEHIRALQYSMGYNRTVFNRLDSMLESLVRSYWPQ
jgi:hypothetical protein